VRDAPGTDARRVCASVKPHNKAAARLKLTTTPDSRRVQNACEMRLEHVQDASGTRANVPLELS